MEKTTFENKTVELAINDAMRAFNTTNKNDLEIKVIEEGSKGFLGFGSKTAIIAAAKIFKPDSIAVNFLRELSISSGLVLTFNTKIEDKNLKIEIVGDDAHALIGKRGNTLDSLQYIVSLVVNKGEDNFINVIIDIENYRERRKETLEKLAINLSKKVLKTKRSVVLEPMSAYERRIIHMALQDLPKIKTASQGSEPYRHVVISFKN